MVYTDDGIEALQTKGIRNGNAETPVDFVFAGSDNTFVGDETTIVNPYEQKTVTWTKSGIHSTYNVQLSSLEAVGSNIQATGLVGSDDTLITIDESFIGTKTNSFNVQVEGEIVLKRPSE